MRVNIDNTEIADSDRTLHGPISEENVGGTTTVKVGLHIKGDTHEETEANWQAAKIAVNKLNARVFVSGQTLGSVFQLDVFPGDGVTFATRCTLSKDTARASTAYAMWGIITITIDQVVPPSGSGPTPGGGGSTRPVFEGQVGDWRLVKTFNEGGVELRSLAVSLGTLFDKEAAGPLAFSAVVSEGGFARFQFASLAGVTAAKATMLYVSGAPAYNGPHEIESIDVALFRITTRTVFSADASGTALIGEQTSPQENLDAQFDDLLALLGVGADGKRDGTTGLVLSDWTHDEQREVITVVLNAQWVQADWNDAIRGLTVSTEVTQVEAWSAEPEAGAAPVNIAATVSFHVTKNGDGNYNPQALWAAVRAQAIAEIKSQAELSDAQGPIHEIVRSDKTATNVIVTLSFLARNVTTLSFDRTILTTEDLQYQAWQAGLNHYMQTAGIPRDQVVAVSVTRVGVGQVVLSCPPPTEPGATFVDINSKIGLDGRRTMRGLLGGATIYAQSRVVVYRRFYFAAGFNPAAVIPSTGTSSPVTGDPPSGSPPTSPPTALPPVITPVGPGAPVPTPPGGDNPVV
jgi:hypothetical protein